jgi:hypothetical protein
MEEVVGSIPTRSTKLPNNLDRANSWRRGHDCSCSRCRLFLRFSISQVDPRAPWLPGGRFLKKRIWVGRYYPIAKTACLAERVAIDGGWNEAYGWGNQPCPKLKHVQNTLLAKGALSKLRDFPSGD